jgi:hypothetical protein
MTNLFLSALSAYATYAKAHFVRKTRHPIATQEQVLRELLQVQQDTELGRHFGLSSIRTIDQFRQQIPIWSYAHYEPYTERIAQGEPNVLNPDPVVYINLTSGTTGKQKKVPVTQRFQRSLGRANAASFGFLQAAMKRHSKGRSQPLELGKLLSTNSVRVQGQTSAGINYGPVTVGSFRMNRFLCERIFAQPFTAMEIADTPSRHYVCLLFALCDSQMRGISTNFPMQILRICQYLEKFAEDLIEDIETGTFVSWLAIDPKIRTALEQLRQPLPQRAQQLRQILQAEGRLTPKQAWSKLSLIGTARGGTSDFYFERFPDYFGDTPVFGGVYGTAEGTFAVCHDLNTDGSILAVDTGFYEFIPRDQWEVEQPQTLLATELKVGQFYRMLVTSYSGFYRYDIGDVVEVVGFYEQTPLIVFRHRRGGLLSSTTEKTTEFHVAQVMQVLQQEFGIGLDDFCVTLSDHEFPARYLVNIELAPGYTLEQPHRFLERFDHWLGEFNNPYATVRSDQVPPPQLRILSSGSFSVVRQRLLLRSGSSDSQLKIPHITEDRHFLDGLQVIEAINL